MFRRLVVAGAIGAAAMYFLDPTNGISRRANALNALDVRLKRLNVALAGAGNRAVIAHPPQALAPTPEHADTTATERLAAAAMSSNRAKTTKRASARTAKKTEPPA